MSLRPVVDLTTTGMRGYVWTTPHGLRRLVDERGTHHIDESEASALAGADPLDHAQVRVAHQARSGALT